MTTVIITDLGFLDEIPRTWLETQLSKTGPWQIKHTVKEKVNCFLNLHLCGDETAYDVRGYLNDEDPDDVWMESIKQNVLPFLLQRGC